jgi:hypothetical protein
MTRQAAVFPHAPATARSSPRRLSADLAIVATAATVLGMFAISPLLLEHFRISYITSGGGAASKFHPASFCAVAAFAFRCLATRNPLRTGLRLITNDSGVVLLLAAAGMAAVYAILIAKTPVTPLFDTFILPVLCFLLLRDLDVVFVRWLALAIAAILCVNAVMAIIEFTGGWHFVTLPVSLDATSDPRRGDAVFDWRADISLDWRAVALLGHPLVNGLIVGFFIICLAAYGSDWLPAWIKLPLLLLEGASMFAFGARASLVMTMLIVSAFTLQRTGAALAAGARLTPRAIAITILLVGVVLIAVGLLDATGFFDRTLQRFSNDYGSAGTRRTMFEMFTPIPWSDLFLGPDQKVVATWQRLLGLEFGIESSWVGLALSYGVLMTAILMIGLLAFARSLARACGRGTIAALGFFFLSVSATASLSGKTTSFAMAAILALLFLRKDERCVPLRAALGLHEVVR